MNRRDCLVRSSLFTAAGLLARSRLAAAAASATPPPPPAGQASSAALEAHAFDCLVPIDAYVTVEGRGRLRAEAREQPAP